MYQTRVFSLGEVTSSLFEEDRLIFVPIKRSGSPISFLTEKKFESPLGRLQVEFNAYNFEYPGYGGTAFSVGAFSGKRNKEFPYLFINFDLNSPVERKDHYLTEIEIRKGSFYEHRRLPSYIKDITLDGVQLRFAGRYNSSRTDNKLGIPYEHFMGNMICRMHLQDLCNFTEKIEEKNARKEACTKYEHFKKIWDDTFGRLARFYVGYLMSKKVNDE